ncbi:hypothetical protein [Mesorhizobium sp. B1-1-6]|uniref:hypothetical protein n=1 Tax=Mesorhizobium sp. B1-1-6 TaxID=2589978 RepID=UPI001126BFE9|nr:hypothetical protein [Mesorhizobium sp. B1-1-6]TPN35265.1 hypothetical protein FJ979_20555 [Mesorhizobium sp. B1-1-6]
MAKEIDLDDLMVGLEVKRGIGRVSHVGRLIEIVKGRPDAHRVAASLEDYERWLLWAHEYEREHGKGSLLDREHPVYVAAAKQVEKIKAAMAERGNVPRSIG